MCTDILQLLETWLGFFSLSQSFSADKKDLFSEDSFGDLSLEIHRPVYDGFPSDPTKEGSQSSCV